MCCLEGKSILTCEELPALPAACECSEQGHLLKNGVVQGTGCQVPLLS